MAGDDRLEVRPGGDARVVGPKLAGRDPAVEIGRQQLEPLPDELTHGGRDRRVGAVVVVGPGPVGFLLAVAARAQGAANVLVVGRADSDRLRFAAALGFRTAVSGVTDLVRDLTAGRGADLVVDATGSAAGIAFAVEVARRRGRMIAVGLSGEPMVHVPWDLAVSRALDVAFSMSSNATAWDPAIAILTGAPAGLEGMTTVFPLVAWEAAFQAVADRTVIKALLDPNAGPAR